MDKFEKEFQIRSYECDQDGYLRVVTLMNILQDAADSSATALGFGFDFCIQNNVLYKCNTPITTPEAWTAAHWTATDIGTELQGRLTPGDVVNNLTSTSTTQPLSAAQGKALAEQIGKFKLPLTTKTTKKSFSGASASSSTFTLSNDTMVTVTAYNGGAVNIYSPSGTTETAICGAYAPSGWSQSSCGNSVYCKAGTYSVYYYGQSSSSSGSVIEWS